MKTKFLLKTFIFGDGQHDTRNGDKNNSCLRLDNSKVRVITSLKNRLNKQVLIKW